MLLPFLLFFLLRVLSFLLRVLFFGYTAIVIDDPEEKQQSGKQCQ